MGTARLANRRSLRKKGWNYVAAGCYFVTMNTHQNRALFGAIVNGRVVLSEAGRVAEGEWRKGAALRKGIELDEFVIMPNHVHGIVRLKGLGAPSPVPGHIRAAGGRGVGDAGGGVQGGGVARDASAGVDSSRPPGLASQLLGCDCSGRAGAGGLAGVSVPTVVNWEGSKGKAPIRLKAAIARLQVMRGMGRKQAAEILGAGKAKAARGGKARPKIRRRAKKA